MSKRIFPALLLVVALLMTSVVALADDITGIENENPQPTEGAEAGEDEGGDDEEECNHPGSYYVVSPVNSDWHVLYCPVCAAADPENPNAGYVSADEEHEFEKKVTEATCTEGGKTVYTCTVCGYTKTENKTKKLLHWFGEWSPVDGGKHSATCKREDCDHVSTATCETAEHNGVTLCPVCGAVSEGERMTMVEGATASASKLPQGEVVVRMGDDMMSVAFEYAGKLTQPTTEVTVTLPATAVEGKTLSIAGEDGTTSEIETTTEDDKVSFTLDFSEDKVVVIDIA